MMKVFKKILIVIGAIAVIYALFLTFEYIRFYNKGQGVKPLFVISQTHNKAEDGYGNEDKYVGLGYSVTYSHSYEKLYEGGEFMGYLDKGIHSDVRFLGFKISISSWYDALEKDTAIFEEK